MIAPIPDTTRICQLTDLHLPLAQKVPLYKLIGKRSLGFSNLRFIRTRTHKRRPFERLCEEMQRAAPELVIITGDLTNLSLAFEFAEVDRVLRRVGLTPQNTIVIPGNHDRYTMGADLTNGFEHGMGDWLPENFSRSGGYPITRVVGSVAVAALDTAVWRSAMRAAGRVDPEQTKRLGAFLDQSARDGLWPLIAMHHPPFRLRRAALRDYRAGLAGLPLFEQAIAPYRATIIHGHLHYLSRRQIGSWDVIGAPSASNDVGLARAQLAFHCYDFNRTGLERARSVQYWPGQADPFKTTELPDEALVS